MSPFRVGADDGSCCCWRCCAAADDADNVTWLLCASVSRPLSMNRLFCSCTMLLLLLLLLLVAPGILSVFVLLSGELATRLHYMKIKKTENERTNE